MAWLRNFFFGNFLLKLFSLILAVTLYAQIHKDTLVRVTTVDVKLFFKYPQDLILTSGTIPTLKVTLQGPESVLKRITAKNSRFTLDLSEALPGSMQTELYTEQLRKIFPVELRVIRVQPSLLDLSFAKLGKKTLPIRVPVHGDPLFGYRLAQPPQPFPSTVNIEGPADVVEQLKQIPTASIDLRGRFRDEVIYVNLYKPDKLIRFVGPENVKVALNFLQRKIKRTIQGVSIQSIDFLNNKMDSTLSPSRVDITLIGPEAHLSPLQNKDLVATVDGSKLVNKPEGSYPLSIQVKNPNPELKVIQIVPAHVTVVLKKRPEPPTTPQPPSPKTTSPPKLTPPKTTTAQNNNNNDNDNDADENTKPNRRRVRKIPKKRRVRKAPKKRRTPKPKPREG